MLNSPRSLYLPAIVLGAFVGFLAWALALGPWTLLPLGLMSLAIVWWLNGDD